MRGKEKMQSKSQLIDLLCELVAIKSITGTYAEIEMAKTVVGKLTQLNYFQGHPEYLQLHPTGDGRYFVTALHKKENARKTIVLVSHFDVVDVEDYGVLKEYAFYPKVLTELMQKRKEEYPSHVQEDLESGEWLFGRGTMDMKCGLAIHMALIEQACLGKFDGNLLLLTVPDEEVNSVGMRTAVPVLVEMAKEYDLQYELVLNSEPTFSLYPGDKNYYMYTGSIGKILPGFLCYGQEMHVGEPFSGLNAALMSAMVTTEMELNTNFCEMAPFQESPPPTAQLQKDLKTDYSVQIPHRSVSLYNLLLMERSIEKTVDMLLETAKKAAEKIERFYHQRVEEYARLHWKESIDKTISVSVYTFEQLRSYAVLTFGTEHIEALEQKVWEKSGGMSDRELSIQLVDEYAMLCNELGPMIILFFAPPFYPAVETSGHPLIQQLREEMTEYAQKTYHIPLISLHYFNGISDLSYVGLKEELSGVTAYTGNVPVWGETYSIPFHELKQLDVPVLNFGPVGRDPHQQTERLHVDYAFVKLKDMLEKLVCTVFSDKG
ncbi:M20/M25/M40 family metallo-hydrolase [Bacillus songklensis]|uniref:M20/M25/M40 family metallo-hydrolase n=1 Tax=Bacillus songklensis TaxID=1069116 RepID=A0ABV8B8G3_9BACI